MVSFTIDRSDSPHVGTHGCSGHALIRIIISSCRDIFTLMSFCSLNSVNVRLCVPAPVSSLI